jgi:hypothetical protein
MEREAKTIYSSRDHQPDISGEADKTLPCHLLISFDLFDFKAKNQSNNSNSVRAHAERMTIEQNCVGRSGAIVCNWPAFELHGLPCQ